MRDARCEEWAFRYFTAYCILQSANRLLPTAQPRRGVTTVDQEGRCEERDRDRGKEGRGTRKCGERRGARCEVKGSVGIKLHTEYRKPPTANRPAPEGPNMSDNEHPTSTQPRRGVTTVDYEGGTWGEGRGTRKCGERKGVSESSCILNTANRKPHTAYRLLPTAYCHENHVKKKGEDSLRPFELYRYCLTA